MAGTQHNRRDTPAARHLNAALEALQAEMDEVRAAADTKIAELSRQQKLILQALKSEDDGAEGPSAEIHALRHSSTGPAKASPSRTAPVVAVPGGGTIGEQAFLLIGQTPGRPWRVPDLCQAIYGEGYNKSKTETVRTAVRRLASRGQIQRDGHGGYMIPVEGAAPMTR